MVIADFNCASNTDLFNFKVKITGHTVIFSEFLKCLQVIAKLIWFWLGLTWFQQLKSGFKRTINWNKYQSKLTTRAWNQYLDDYLIDSSFQGVNRFFVLSSKNIDHQTSYKLYFLPTVEDYSVMIDGRTFFDQPVKQ